MSGKRWQRHHIELEESILTVLCDSPFLRVAQRAVAESRALLQSFISGHPEFARTFEPMEVGVDVPDLVKRMCRAGNLFDVGPMAAVAGAIAEYTLQLLLDAGAREAVVDNGGDIVFKIDKPIKIGVYSGASRVRNLAFYIEPFAVPMSVCTSSGTVGHSYSEGKSDAAVVFSADACIADAAATALGNRISKAADLDSAFEIFERTDKVSGALAIIENRVALWGELPKIVRSEVDQELITRGNSYGKN